MMELLFASHNNHKLEEIRQMLPSGCTLKGLVELNFHEDIPETGPTLRENALIKARFLYNKTGLDCFADDSGLEVEALNGAPGVHSARYAGLQKSDESNIRLLLQRMDSLYHRRACFKTVIALISHGREYVFEGKVNGSITREKRGTNGFGYDPVFVPEGFGISFAEMTPAQKNSISHRKRALEQMMHFLGGSVQVG